MIFPLADLPDASSQHVSDTRVFVQEADANSQDIEAVEDLDDKDARK